MQDLNVLVAFSSRTGVTERLALVAAVGAIQARGNIRLRWLSEDVDTHTISREPEWKENRDRMEQEYIAPREIDMEWAHAIIVGIPARANSSSAEVKVCLDLLARSPGKLVTALVSGAPDAKWIEAALARLGSIVIPCDETGADVFESARLQGRRVTEAARARKPSLQT